MLGAAGCQRSDSAAITNNRPQTAHAAPSATSEVASNDGLSADIVALGRSPDGFEYLVAYPPANGGGNGQILVQTPTGDIPALADEAMVLPRLRDMRFGPDGLVGFISDHYNYGPLVFVGRIDQVGKIRDLHRVGDHFSERPRTIDRFDATGNLIAGHFTLDTTTDPRFVNTATAPPRIEGRALIPSVDSAGGRPSGAWHLGETLSGDPACGASTVYRVVPDGWQRVLHPATELDTIVAVHATELRSTGGIETTGVGREMVIATECPADYDGQRLYWGYDGVDYGDGGPPLVSEVWPFPIDDLVVDAVINVTPILDSDWGFVSDLLLEVRTLDGETMTLGVTRIYRPKRRATFSVRPVLGLDTTEAIPIARIDDAAWLIQSASSPDQVVRVEPTTGDIVDVIWQENRGPGIRGQKPLGGQSLSCPGRDPDGRLQLIEVFYELRGDLLDLVTVAEIVDGEMVNGYTEPISGSNIPLEISHICGRPRVPPLLVTSTQLVNLLEVAGFVEIGIDHPIDPVATAGGSWTGQHYVFTLDQSPDAVDRDRRTAIECLMGVLVIDESLPEEPRSVLEELCMP